MVKTLFPFDLDDPAHFRAEVGAKDGAISPALANRYGRFALSHRPYDY
jgi:hypothetical protein